MPDVIAFKLLRVKQMIVAKKNIQLLVGVITAPAKACVLYYALILNRINLRNSGKSRN